MDRLTQSNARNTSVTLNLLSTLHSTPSSSPTMPTNVSRHRSPHHAAGRVLSPRQRSRGMCQRLLTPRRTATEGWSTDLRRAERGLGGVGRRAAREEE